MINILSNIFIGAGFAFMFFGAFGLFKMKNFFPRVLAASKIDTVGLLTLFTGFIGTIFLSLFLFRVQFVRKSKKGGIKND